LRVHSFSRSQKTEDTTEFAQYSNSKTPCFLSPTFRLAGGVGCFDFGGPGQFVAVEHVEYRRLLGTSTPASLYAAEYFHVVRRAVTRLLLSHFGTSWQRLFDHCPSTLACAASVQMFEGLFLRVFALLDPHLRECTPPSWGQRRAEYASAALRLLDDRYRRFATRFHDGHRYLHRCFADMVNKTGNQRASTMQYLPALLQGLLPLNSPAGKVCLQVNSPVTAPCLFSTCFVRFDCVTEVLRAPQCTAVLNAPTSSGQLDGEVD
jgi:hypothetical protein